MKPYDSRLARIALTYAQVFPTDTGRSEEEYFAIDDWARPVTYFVGRNGSGKSRTAKALAATGQHRLLATDRLVGLMSFRHYAWGAEPMDFKGVPISDEERLQVARSARKSGGATDELYALREQPEVWLRVAAFLRRALGRTIELRESAGFIDPFVRLGDVEYSLLRDEGHGLRELVVLLAATYRADSYLLVVDEPELHLHPSMARLWLTELNRECAATGRRAIVVTHNPEILRPSSFEDLKSIWLFHHGVAPRRISDCVMEVQQSRVTASLVQRPALVSQLVFSPRPVLVEGDHDVAALTTALRRTQPPEVVAQTELVNCGGSGNVGLWLEIATALGIDVRAVGDLDMCCTKEIARTMDAKVAVQGMYRSILAIEPPSTALVLNPIINHANNSGVAKDSASRASWLATMTEPEGHVIRLAKLLEIWRSAGLWLHKQGTLEQVLGIDIKGKDVAATAAQEPGDIDAVAAWCAYDLDVGGDLELLLNVAVESIAHSIMEAQRETPGAVFHAAVGPGASAANRIVKIEPVNEETHRITVVAPDGFAGHWLEFSRDTPSSKLELQAPD